MGCTHLYFAFLVQYAIILHWNLVKLPIKQCYLKNIWLPISDKLFCKLLIRIYFQCFLWNEKNYSNVSVFSVFTQTHKTKSIVNLYQIELLGYFSEYIKMWPSHMCWIGTPVTGCYTTYMQIICAYIPMLILCYFEYTTVVKKYQGIKLL